MGLSGGAFKLAIRWLLVHWLLYFPLVPLVIVLLRPLCCCGGCNYCEKVL
jgi:hypothetical protein